MAFGMYSCLQCAEYVYGKLVDVQAFIGEHMCESTDETTKVQRVKQLKDILQQDILENLAKNAPKSLQQSCEYFFCCLIKCYHKNIL